MGGATGEDPESLAEESALVCDKHTFESFPSTVNMSANIVLSKGYDFII